jgi:hypothetical protein
MVKRNYFTSITSLCQQACASKKGHARDTARLRLEVWVVTSGEIFTAAGRGEKFGCRLFF